MISAPFFIVGFQRSGTTLLRLMLDNHPAIAIPLDTVGLWARYETRVAERYHNLAESADRERLVADLLLEERIRLWEMDFQASEILEVMQGTTFPAVIDAFNRAYANRQGKSIWGDKDPGNMTRIDQINRWFPGSRFVHLIRDGRDACLSQLKQTFGFDDVLECAQCWREEVLWVRRMGGLLGSTRYLELRYEDLLEDTELQLKRICAFLEVPFTDRMLDYHRDIARSIPESKRHIWKLIDKPPQRDNAGRWKRDMSPGLRTGFEKRAWDLLRDLHYETFPSVPSGGQFEEVKSFSRRILKSVNRRIGGRK